jgi:uncharacterized protein YndB with AHSA1/START domain
MSIGNKTRNQPGEQAVVITRVFDAPPEMVFREWTDPECLKAWWGPNGFTTPLCKIDLRPGGVFHNCMRSPEGQDYCSKGIYREIVPPEKIVCSDYFVDENGKQVPATYYGMSSTWPIETLVTVTFSETEGRTQVTLKHDVGPVPETERELCEQGWSESLDKLAGHLANH